MADKKSSITEQYYTPPPKLSGWESFKIFMWNGETSEFLGRTASSWGKLILKIHFFTIHYFSSAMQNDLFVVVVVDVCPFLNLIFIAQYIFLILFIFSS